MSRRADRLHPLPPLSEVLAAVNCALARGETRRSVAAGVGERANRLKLDGSASESGAWRTLMRARHLHPPPSADELFRTAFDEAPIGMCLVARDGALLKVNTALCRLLGYAPEELRQLPFTALTHADDRPKHEAMLEKLSGGVLERFEIRKTCVRRDGTTLPVLMNVAAVRDGSGEVGHLVAQVQDLTSQLYAERALRDSEEAHRRVLELQARHDSVTGLPNRRELAERLDLALRRTAAGGKGTAVLFCDVDNFKAVNDSWGHAVGDELLSEVARRMTSLTSASETVCRFGGDEFVVLMDGVETPGLALAAARHFSALFEQPFVVGTREFVLTVSVGVAYSPTGAMEDAESVTRNADTAMCRAKALGKNQVVPFSEAMRQELLERVQLEAELRRGLLRRQFLCHYQPILDLESRCVSQVEALVRWQHPDRGLLGPGAFLPLAEHSGLLVPLGEQVLEQSIAQAAAWRATGINMRVCINIASQQLGPALTSIVARHLDAHGLEPSAISLELTESALLDTGHDNMKLLKELAGLGVHLALDDFGTGYSSFAYLRDLPVHVVKLDRSFITRLDTDERDARVVAGMIRLGHELGLRVVAEGVETPKQLEMLLQLGCDEAQGYYFARPSVDPFAYGQWKREEGGFIFSRPA